MSTKQARKFHGVRRPTRRPRDWARWFFEGRFEFVGGAPIRLRRILAGAEGK